ncbi:hypothetical protein CYMTET_16835 [Cymbomonas tetramitiformis]|uniref:Phospholipid scramblase n=1 Tax=Cymbomonas tetramitiformis TaxID=36881 RepID=A0AAE0L7X5_9CHLO|nr:hypothetical protein CYMTET_16835 [Cymbomonas tetramitiformis]
MASYPAQYPPQQQDQVQMHGLTPQPMYGTHQQQQPEMYGTQQPQQQMRMAPQEMMIPGCGCCSDSEDPTYCYYKYPDNAPPPIASVYEPIGGGGLKPQLNVIARGIQSSDYSNTPGDIMAKVVGPCIFGGCSEYCFDTSFQVKNPRYPDASIKKQAPTNFSEAGRTAFTDSDTYQINFGQNMTPYEKATLLTTALLVDYKFFEFDRESCCPLPKGCDIASTEKGFEIVITCFKCSCYGCICPCQVSIPIETQGDDN